MSLMSLVSASEDFLLVKKDIAQKLIACGDCDGAGLYLYLLLKGRNFDEETARKELGFDKVRFERAVFTLTKLDLIVNSEDDSEKKLKSPAYDATELRDARVGDHRFAAVCQSAESALGRTLTEAQLKTLFTAYDHLGLPPDVIILLLTDLKAREKVTRKLISEETYLWADLGINSLKKATDYLERRDNEEPLIEKFLEILGVYDRKATANEKRYLSEFVRKGFPAEAFALAKERAENAIGKFSFRYVKGIMDNWHQAGVHTPSEIDALEPKKPQKKTPAEKNYIDQTSPQGQLAEWEIEWLREIGKYEKTKEG